MNDARPRRWWAPLAPALLLFTVGLVPPVLVLVGLSFYTYVPGNLPEPVPTLDNFIRFITTPLYTGILLRSVGLSLGAAVITNVVAYPMAFVLIRKAHVRRFLLPIVALAFFVSAIVLLTGWLAILGRRGLINTLLLSTGLLDRPVSLLYTDLAVMIGLAAFTIPFSVFILAAALNNVDVSLEQAAQNLGATATRTFLRVTLPLTWTGVASSVVLAFSLSISAVLTPLILGGGRVQMIASSVYDSILVSANYPFAAAQVVLMLLVILVVTTSITRARGMRAA